MRKRLLVESLRLANKSLANHPMKDMGFTHFSFVVLDNKIVEMGMNNYRVPNKHWGYDTRYKGWDSNFIARTHSELDAYRRAKGLIKNQEWDLINIRLNSQGEMKNSCPCSVCSSWLTGGINCNRIFFTTDAGWAKLF